MVDDEDHVPVECHNSNYGKRRMGDKLFQTSPSRGRSPTMGADIISHAFPGRPLSFQQSIGNVCRTKNERYDYDQTAYTSLILSCIVHLALNVMGY
jgi:hypothetical protein